MVWIVTLLEKVLGSNSNTVSRSDIQALKKPMLQQKSLSTVQAFPSIRIVGASGKSLNTTVPGRGIYEGVRPSERRRR
jgi:hypothetical protein